MQKSNVRVYASAKLNLTLDILGRREDGYHLLDMVMQSVSIYDTLILSESPKEGLSLICDNATIPCDEGNTVHKAFASFLKYTGISGIGVEIHITKRIPSEAGLAGGSADAAAVLHALNQMYDVGLTKSELCEIGLTVGSDVPFCVCGGTMRARGTGEILTPLQPLPPCYFVVCKPAVSVNTAQAYVLSDQTSGNLPAKTPSMLKALQEGNLEKICANFGNSFESVLRLEQVLELEERMISCGAMGACMTGSGSAVYGAFPRRREAELCRERLLKHYPRVFVCEPVENPYHPESF